MEDEEGRVRGRNKGDNMKFQASLTSTMKAVFKKRPKNVHPKGAIKNNGEFRSIYG